MHMGFILLTHKYLKQFAMKELRVRVNNSAIDWPDRAPCLFYVPETHIMDFIQRS